MSTLSFFLPELIIFCGAIFLLLLGSFSQCSTKKSQCPIFPLAKASYFAIIFCLFAIFFAVKNLNILLSQDLGQVHLMQMMVANGFNYLVKIFALIILLLIFLASFSFSQKISNIFHEFIALIMFATLGGMILISANNYLLFYLGLEMQALSLYLLASIGTKDTNSKICEENNKLASESGMK